MAYRTIYLDKGQCQHCSGSGWEPEINKQPETNFKQLHLPDAFDLGKCTMCGGSTREIEVQ